MKFVSISGHGFIWFINKILFGSILREPYDYDFTNVPYVVNFI